MTDSDTLSFIYDVDQSWILAGLAMVYITYYITYVVKKPTLVCANTKLRKFATTHMPILEQQYWPTIWCFQGQLHTLMKAILNIKQSAKLEYRRELISTADGGEICLDWIDADTESMYSEEERPTVILIPGIAGSSAEGYAVQMVEAVQNLGYRPVVFNNRGLGGSQLRTPRTFCVTNTDDLRTVVCHIKRLHPHAPLLAAGASAGGINLFHYLCKYGEDCQLNGAMFVSVLYEMFLSTKSLESFPNVALFNNTLTRGMLERIVVPNLPMLRQNKYNLDINHLLKARTIRQFHTRLTVPMFGYKDWESYYRECNLVGKMHRIRIPTLFMNAGDDPFTPLSSIPIDEMEQQDNIMLVVTSHGGHAGFLEGLIPTGPGLVNKVFSQFVDAIFKHGEVELHEK